MWIVGCMSSQVEEHCGRWHFVAIFPTREEAVQFAKRREGGHWFVGPVKFGERMDNKSVGDVLGKDDWADAEWVYRENSLT